MGDLQREGNDRNCERNDRNGMRYDRNSRMDILSIPDAVDLAVHGEDGYIDLSFFESTRRSPDEVARSRGQPWISSSADGEVAVNSDIHAGSADSLLSGPAIVESIRRSW